MLYLNWYTCDYRLHWIRLLVHRYRRRFAVYLPFTMADLESFFHRSLLSRIWGKWVQTFFENILATGHFLTSNLPSFITFAKSQLSQTPLMVNQHLSIEWFCSAKRHFSTSSSSEATFTTTWNLALPRLCFCSLKSEATLGFTATKATSTFPDIH